MISLVPLYDARRKGTNGHGKHFSRFSNCDSVLFLSQQNAKLIELSGWAKYSCRALNSTAECSREVPSPARQIQPVVQSRIRLLNKNLCVNSCLTNRHFINCSFARWRRTCCVTRVCRLRRFAGCVVWNDRFSGHSTTV